MKDKKLQTRHESGPKERLVRFDWAMKRLLRHRQDHSVLNGLLTSLLGRKIEIEKILESESNREYEENKSNRVDILARDADGSNIIIEVQNETESSYLHRMLFGTSKLITELLEKGSQYDDIKKIYSINIVYFNIDEGSDYVYHGTTSFKGLHTGEPLVLPSYIKGKYSVENPGDIFPEYYILKADNFDKYAVTPLEQWMHFLSHSELPDNADAPGLKEAAEQLREAYLSREERADYFSYLDGLRSISAAVDTALYRGKLEGRAEGREEGRAEGRAEGILAIARNMKEGDIDISDIVRFTGLSEEEILSL